ncbi:MAG: Hpt domain-containing protein [Candidatus Latescibacterota bacterium]|nr:Hpt domain-containing protein [Candidatus Latescibacterota bacterium]
MAERTAHSLKGIAGTIGAGQLENVAQMLEVAIRDDLPPTEIEAILTTVRGETEQVADAVRLALGLGGSSDRPIGGSDTLDLSEISNLPGLVEGMAAEQAHIEELLVTLAIDELAGRIGNLSREHDCTPLRAWSDSVSEAAAAFDIDGVKQQFETYVNLLQQLRQ